MATDWGGSLEEVLSSRPRRTDIDAARLAFDEDRPLSGGTNQSDSGRSAYTFVRDPNSDIWGEQSDHSEDLDNEEFDQFGVTDEIGGEGGGTSTSSKYLSEQWTLFWESLCDRSLGKSSTGGRSWSMSADSASALDHEVCRNGGLSLEACRRLHLTKASSLGARGGNDCAVCVEALGRLVDGKGVIVELPCCHAFHAMCVSPWLRRHTTCPLCRSDAREEPQSSRK